MQSADWSQLLAPFGVIRASDPQNMRTLIAIDPTVEAAGGDEAVAAPVHTCVHVCIQACMHACIQAVVEEVRLEMLSD